MFDPFENRLTQLVAQHLALITRPNELDQAWDNGIYRRYRYPVVTAAHGAPLAGGSTSNQATNPYLLERIGVNAAFNAGAIEVDGQILLVVRVEGGTASRCSPSPRATTGVDGFCFWDEPISMPETADPDTNVYDMRVVRHEDGWIYGIFCTERKDPKAPPGDLSSAVGPGRHRPDQGPGDLGAPARPGDAFAAAAQSGIPVSPGQVRSTGRQGPRERRRGIDRDRGRGLPLTSSP